MQVPRPFGAFCWIPQLKTIQQQKKCFKQQQQQWRTQRLNKNQENISLEMLKREMSSNENTKGAKAEKRNETKWTRKCHEKRNQGLLTKNGCTNYNNRQVGGPSTENNPSKLSNAQCTDRPTPLRFLCSRAPKKKKRSPFGADSMRWKIKAKIVGATKEKFR